MTTARFVAAARFEFLGQIEYYRNESRAVGERFRQAVEVAIGHAIAFPHAGSPIEHRLRRVMVRGFPFAVIYRPVADGVVIFAVAHHSRRPGYWVSRIEPQDR